jgi:predicted outer membrane repeat protein
MVPRFVSALVLGTALLLLAYPAHAAIFNIANGDILALKNAITTANANGEDDTIELATNGTYTLTSADNGLNGLPQIGPGGGHKLTIHGNGATIQRSSAGGTPSFRIFYLNSLSNVLISGLTIDNGGSGMHGAAIYINGESGNATLTLADSTITNNYGDYGGAVYNDGHGGSATLIVTNCTFSDNLSDNSGGAIYNDGGSGGNATLTVTGSTFSLNFTNSNNGGAIQHDGSMGGAAGSITNCTFNVNYAPGDGGAIYVGGQSGSAALSISNCTFYQNTADGSGTLYNSGSNGIQIVNNIFKSDGFTQNIVNATGTITSIGHNLSDDSGSGVLTGPGDRINTNPMLDSAGLQSNGGPTQTVALLSNSPAINAGDDAHAPPRDQRSYLRSGVSDIGAFEFGGTLAPVSAGSSKTHGAAGAFAVDLPLTGTVGIECRTGGANGVHQLVMPFATPVTATGANVSSGTGSVSSFTVTGSQVTVNLTGVADAQQINVTLTSVSDGIHTNNVNIPMRILLGDTTANNTVNASDVAQTKAQLGQGVTNSNFRADVNVNGTINASDVALVKSRVGTSIPVAAEETKPVRDLKPAQ